MTEWDQEGCEAFAIEEINPMGLQSTPKIPPSFDGRISRFAFEEAVDDWFDITTLAPEKQAPSLKNIFTGDAVIYKPLLESYGARKMA